MWGFFTEIGAVAQLPVEDVENLPLSSPGELPCNALPHFPTWGRGYRTALLGLQDSTPSLSLLKAVPLKNTMCITSLSYQLIKHTEFFSVRTDRIFFFFFFWSFCLLGLQLQQHHRHSHSNVGSEPRL